MRSVVLFAALLLFPSLALAAEPEASSPHWSLELKGGVFFPGIANWSRVYGQSYTGEYGGALAYKVTRQIEVGVEGTYIHATGGGVAPLHAQSGAGLVPTGEVTYELVPLNVFVLARGVLHEKQRLVPYLGGGYTRMLYREDVRGQGTTHGSANGFHARGGVQFLLDALESDAAETLYREYHLRHSYFFVEGKYTRVMADTIPSGSVNTGGGHLLAGLLFEF